MKSLWRPSSHRTVSQALCRNYCFKVVASVIAVALLAYELPTQRSTPRSYAQLNFVAGNVRSRRRKSLTQLGDAATRKEIEELLKESERLQAEAAALRSGTLTEVQAEKSAMKAEKMIRELEAKESKRKGQDPQESRNTVSSPDGEMLLLEQRYEEAVKKFNKAKAFKLGGEDKLEIEVNNLYDQLEMARERIREEESRRQPVRTPTQQDLYLGRRQTFGGRTMAELEEVATMREELQFDEDWIFMSMQEPEVRTLLDEIKFRRQAEKKKKD